MKLGGLFSGVGGFELAWTQLGHEVAWMCEWDAKARKVLEARFPGVPIYPDVRDLDPAEVEAVDVLTGGSPCQGFSVAGNRTGLEHSESQLFRDYIRIMDGLAERGLRYALWENVPGVLSITNEDGERTFNHVVAALAGGTEPVRLRDDKRWNTGMAAGRGRAVAWRVLDSRYFGVAQRRRRVFACVAFGDSCEDRAGRALLAVAEGVRGDSSSGVEAGQGTAGGAEGRAGVPSVAGTLGIGTGGNQIDTMTYLPDHPAGYRMSAFGQYEDDDSPSTLKQRDHKDATDLVVTHALTSSASKGATEYGTGRGTPITVQAFNWQQGDAEYSLRDDASALAADSRPAVMLHVRGGVDRDRHGKLAGKGPLLSYELSATLDATQPWTLFEPRSFDEMNFTTDADAHHVLRAGTKQSTGVMVPQAFRKSARAQSSEDAESSVADGQANTLNVFDVGDTRTTHAIVEPEPWGFSAGNSQHARSMGEEQGVAPPIRAGASGTNQSPTVGPVQYGVRRLTPVECERLQSFPDGWTEPAGSDSARYKAMGNAVTVNVVRWILNRMVQAR